MRPANTKSAGGSLVPRLPTNLTPSDFFERLAVELTAAAGPYPLQQSMFAFPPIADVCGASRDVCFGPIADIGASGIQDESRYFPGIIVGIFAGIAAPLSCWKVGSS